MDEGITRRGAIGVVAAMGLAGLASTGTAIATEQGLDLESMSVDDLVALRDQVEQAIAEKLGTDTLTTMPAGSYKVGRDIPAGTYTFAPLMEFTELTDESYANATEADIGIYSGDDDGDSIYHRFLSFDNDETNLTFTLEDGETLDLSRGEFQVTPVVLPFAVSQTSDDSQASDQKNLKY